MLRRLVPVLLTVAVVALGVAALVVRPATRTPAPTADYVLLAGVPGLRWDDVDPQTTPTLWRMAEGGAIGSLSVRSARQPTCPVDGWQTLGAGNFAAWDATVVADRCPPLDVTVEQPDAISANLPDQRATVTHNQDRLRWGTVPGALAESVRCTVAVGPGAAVAAARPSGLVDRYAEELPPDPTGLLDDCVLGIIDLGTVSGDDPRSGPMPPAAPTPPWPGCWPRGRNVRWSWWPASPTPTGRPGCTSWWRTGRAGGVAG
ncbi:hypothetical protein GCM10027615_65050 [Plantactinospora veratri]